MAEEPRGPTVRELEAQEPGPGEPVARERDVYETTEPRGAAVREREPIVEERYYPPPPEEPRQTSALALASLATGISAYFLFPIIGAITAIVTGFLAQSEIRASNGRLGGAAFATAGLVLGWVQIGLVIAFAILIGAFAATDPGIQAQLPQLLFSR